jgi:O-antigen/teichoic acid export membrane protein
MASPSEVSGRRLVKNTSVNAAAGVVSALLTIGLTPFLLHRLGASDYGIWLLATTLTLGSGYLAVADLGLPEATVKFIADARARGDTEGVNHVVSTTVVLFAASGVVLALAVVALAGVLSHVFNIADSSRPLAGHVFAIVGIQICVDLPAAGLLAVVEGAQNYFAYRLVDVGARIAWAAAVVLAVETGHGVVALAALSLAVAAVRCVAAYVAAAFVQRGLRIRTSLVRRQVLRDVAGFASALVGVRILSIVYWQMDRAIIGITLTAAAVARYEVAYRIHSTALFALSIMPSAVMPAAAYLGAAQHADRLRNLYLRGTKYAVGISLPVTFAALLFAPWIIIAWVGPEYAGVTGAARLFLLYPAFAVVHVIALAILVGLGRMREVLTLNAVSVVVNLVVSIVLAPHLGITGVIVGTLAGYVVIWVPYTRLFLREFGVSLDDWTRSIVLPALPGSIAQVGVALLIDRFVSRPDNILAVAALVSCDIAVGLAVFVLFGLDGEERQRFRRTVLARGGASG